MKPNKYILLLISLIILFLYFNTVNSSFHFDDNTAISREFAIHIERLNWENIKNVVTHSSIKNRPVANLSLAFNYYIDKLNVRGYHIFNILIHILSGLILYLLLNKTFCLTKSYRKHHMPLALAATLLWVSHPINIQAVTYIVQRMTSMAAMFYLLSILLYITARQKNNGNYILYIMSGTAWILALGCKEISAVLPFIIFLYEITIFRTDLKKSFLFLSFLLIPIIFAGIFYLGGPSSVIETFKNISENTFHNRGYTIAERLLTQSRVLFFYLLLLSFPLSSRLTLDYDFDISRGLIDPLSTSISIIFLIFIILYAFVMVRKKKIFGLCILWYFLNLLIESSIFNLELIFEHRLYLPSIGPILLFVIIIYEIFKNISLKYKVSLYRHTFSLLGIFIVIAFSLFTISRNFIWIDEYTLWSNEVKNSPYKSRAYQTLGLALSEKQMYAKAVNVLKQTITFKSRQTNYLFLGNLYKKLLLFEKAENAYKKAIKKNPRATNAWNQLGLIYVSKRKIDQAIGFYKIALNSNKPAPEVFNNIGIAYEKKGLYVKALEMFTSAYSIDTSIIAAIANKAGVYKKLRLWSKAEKTYLYALKRVPSSPKILFELGLFYEEKGLKDKAVFYYSKSIKINKSVGYNARNNLGNLLMKKGLLIKAYNIFRDNSNKPEFLDSKARYNVANVFSKLGLYNKALYLLYRNLSSNPFNAQSINAIGIVYAKQGRFKKAAEMFKKSLKVNPGYKEAKRNLKKLIAMKKRNNRYYTNDRP